jgi:hypothetical protein
MKAKLSMSVASTNLNSATETSLTRLLAAIHSSQIEHPDAAAKALCIVRDGVITGEGPTTSGRVHFSRSLDAQDAELCARLLFSASLNDSPVSRAEAEVLFQIDEAASERSDKGRFDDLLAKAIVHHAAAASGLPVPPRGVALSPETPIESWAPTRAIGVDTEVLEWISSQMRGRRNGSKALMAVATMLIGAATLQFVQALPGLFDFSM